MNALQTVHNENLDAVTARILELKQKTAEDVIALGLALKEAKKIVPHGQWGRYLEDQVQFSQRTANNYMRLADTFGKGKWKSISNLSSTKLIAISGLPEGEQDALLQMPDITEISVNELKERIKESKNRKPTLAEQIIQAFGEPTDEIIALDEFEIDISELNDIPNHDLFFPRRTGEQWLHFLMDIQKNGVRIPIMISRDFTILSGYERVRAVRDLGITKIKAYYAAPLRVEGFENYIRERKTVDYIKMHHFIWSNWNGHNSESDYCRALLALIDGDIDEYSRRMDFYEQTRDEKDESAFQRLEELIAEIQNEDIKNELVSLLAFQRKWRGLTKCAIA